MSLRQLSQTCSVSVSKLSLFERGEIRLPAEEVARIAAVLNEFLGETPAFATDEELIQYLEQEQA